MTSNRLARIPTENLDAACARLSGVAYAVLAHNRNTDGMALANPCLPKWEELRRELDRRHRARPALQGA